MKRQIVLLHGALGSSRQLEGLSEVMNDDFEVRLFECSGHGGQPIGKEFSISSFARELKNFIKTEQLKAPLIFGYSMGGYVALKLASTDPGFLGDIICLGTKFNWSEESVQRELRMLDPEKIEQKVPSFAEALRQRHQPTNWKSVVARTGELMEDLAHNSKLQKNDFESIESRVLLCVGELDNMVSKEETREAAKQLSKGTFIVLNGVEHPIESVSKHLLREQIQSFFSA